GAAAAGDLGELLTPEAVGQERRRGLADGAATPGERDVADGTGRLVDGQHHRDPVATQRVVALVRGVGLLDGPEVMGRPVVLEDEVAVQVVHGRSPTPSGPTPGATSPEPRAPGRSPGGRCHRWSSRR